MQFNSIASILILSVSAASISALDASNLLQEQVDNQSRGGARKRTAQEIYQEPTFGDRVYDVARSLYSVGSSLGSLGWSVGALTFSGFKAVGSFAQTSLSTYQNPERTQFRAAVARPHLISAVDQRMDQPQLQHAPRFKSAAPDILPGRVLSYVGLHKDIITLKGVNYRVHFDMQSMKNNSAIDDEGELSSRIKVSLLHFEKFKEKDNAIYYMAVGSNEHNTMLAYSGAYPGLRMYVTLTKAETRPLNLLPIQDLTNDDIQERQSKRQRGSSYEKPLGQVPAIQPSLNFGAPINGSQSVAQHQSSSFDFGVNQRSSGNRTHSKPVQRMNHHVAQKQTRMIDLTFDEVFQVQPQRPQTQTRFNGFSQPFMAPVHSHVTILDDVDFDMVEDHASSVVMPALEADIHIALPQPQNTQRSSTVLDLEDDASLARTLNQYNPERQRNRIQEVYVEWFRGLNERSGLKLATQKERYYEEKDPYNARGKAEVEAEIRQARVNLRHLAAQNPVYRILTQHGFSTAEIKNAKDTLFLNFYDQ